MKTRIFLAINFHWKVGAVCMGLLGLAGCASEPADDAATGTPQNVGTATPQLYQEPLPPVAGERQEQTLPIYDKLNAAQN